MITIRWNVLLPFTAIYLLSEYRGLSRLSKTVIFSTQNGNDFPATENMLPWLQLNSQNNDAIVERRVVENFEKNVRCRKRFRHFSSIL